MLLNLIQTKIQSAQLRRLSSKKNSTDANAHSASGKIICSIIEVNDLKRSQSLPKGA